MALWFDLRINAQTIGNVEIRRRSWLDLDDPLTADTWNTYDVRRDGVLVGQVRHRYGHGAWKLLALAASLLDETAQVSASSATHAAENAPGVAESTPDPSKATQGECARQTCRTTDPVTDDRAYCHGTGRRCPRHGEVI